MGINEGRAGMKPHLCALAACLLPLSASPVVANVIDVSAQDPWVLSPSNVSATVLTFNDLPVGILPHYQFNGGTLTGSGAIENTSLIHTFAQPAGIDGNFLTVSSSTPGGEVRLTFLTEENYFGLYWGSIDAYNSLNFRRDGVDLEAFTGSDIALLTGLISNGSWLADSSNRYVNFYTGTNFYDEVILSTSSYGFEIASIAFGGPTIDVPEPSTLLLLGSFLSAFALVRRRRYARPVA